MNTLLLYIAIAVVEILGCYQPWHWMKQQARRSSATHCCQPRVFRMASDLARIYLGPCVHGERVGLHWSRHRLVVNCGRHSSVYLVYRWCCGGTHWDEHHLVSIEMIIATVVSR